MSITSGYTKYKRYQKLSDGTYQLVSQWTSSNTVHFDDGATAEAKIATMQTAIDGVNTKVNNLSELSAKQVEVLNERMNTFTALEDGSTTGDAELIDARIDKDGNIHENVGEHIRNIASQLSGDLDGLNNTVSGLKYVNIFNKENIVKGKIYNPYVNGKDTEFQIVENGFYSTDKYRCKQGDVIYYSAAYIYLLVYDGDGNCVEVFNPATIGSVVVTNSNAEYFRYTCSASDKVYVDRFVLSVNTPLPDTYVPYGVIWEQYNNNKNFYMPKIIISVDYSFSEITNPHITYGLENGIRFVFNGQSENARTLLKKGCDLGTYSNDSDYLPDLSTINSENDKDLKAWDNYVKHALSLQETKGFVRPVLWECYQLRYGTALEKALKNNGYIYARCGQSGNGFYPIKNVNYQQFDCIVPTDTTLDRVKTAINNCYKESKTLCILFHKVLDTVPDGDTWDISTEYYRQIIDYLLPMISDGKILVVTPNDLYNLSNPTTAHIRDTEKIINLIN